MLPRTAKTGTSFVAAESSKTGPPMTHVIHAWTGLFQDLLKCIAMHASKFAEPSLKLEDYALEASMPQDKVYFVDGFCCNQHSATNRLRSFGLSDSSAFPVGDARLLCRHGDFRWWVSQVLRLRRRSSKPSVGYRYAAAGQTRRGHEDACPAARVARSELRWRSLVAMAEEEEEDEVPVVGWQHSGSILALLVSCLGHDAGFAMRRSRRVEQPPILRRVGREPDPRPFQLRIPLKGLERAPSSERGRLGRKRPSCSGDAAHRTSGAKSDCARAAPARASRERRGGFEQRAAFKRRRSGAHENAERTGAFARHAGPRWFDTGLDAGRASCPRSLARAGTAMLRRLGGLERHMLRK